MANLFQISGLLLAALVIPSLSNPIQATNITAKTKNDKPLLGDFDALGAWYDGVAAINHSSIPRRSNVSIAIVGGGISGLATALMLDSVGVHDWQILEASERVGGRFRTKYVGGTQEWAEMGPMRLPYSIKYKSDNSTHEYTDHRMVWQLADWMNELNHNDSALKVNFIPWIQHHPNELLARGTGRLPDGRVPTRADIAANSSLAVRAPLLSMEYNGTKEMMNRILKDEKRLKAIQRDVWRVHGQVMNEGLDDVSEQAMMRLEWKASENVTDAIWTNSDYDVFWDEIHHNSNLAQDGSSGSLGETEWKCVDGGFNMLSDAFIPHVSSRLALNRKITKVEAIESNGETGNRLSWYEGSGKNRTIHSKEFD